MSTVTILVIEPDANLQSLLRLLLTSTGYVVYLATDYATGLRSFYQHRPHLVLCDLQPTNPEHWETLRLLRLLADVPILIMSTSVSEQTRERGRQFADEYLLKPFHWQELLPRIQALLTKDDVLTHPTSPALPLNIAFSQAQTRPTSPEAEPTIPPHHRTVLGSLPTKVLNPAEPYLKIDFQQRRVYVGGQLVRLTDIEFRLLECLAKQTGSVLTYQQILAYVWGWRSGRDHHYVHVHISRLRQKLEKNPKEPQYLLTEHGVGYWLRGCLHYLLWIHGFDLLSATHYLSFTTFS